MCLYGYAKIFFKKYVFSLIYFFSLKIQLLYSSLMFYLQTGFVKATYVYLLHKMQNHKVSVHTWCALKFLLCVYLMEMKFIHMKERYLEQFGEKMHTFALK